MAGEVPGKPPKYFVCTPARLLSAQSKPVKPHVALEPGRIYLLLPYSALQADLSPMDLSALVRKLTPKAKAQSHRSWSNGNSPGRLRAHHGGSSPSSSSPGRIQPDCGAQMPPGQGRGP
ncbi:hypothetical protein NL676_014300 [Syzygium grande]|nr:hypothetical protein NL676_014300 [Syzygium grande]